MENPQAKRQMHHPLTPQTSDPYVASLATVGMRIRKSVADGHYEKRQYSYMPQHYNSAVPAEKYSNLNSQPRAEFERTPLPSHLSEPPALTNVGSTFQTGSNVSEWGSHEVNVTSLPSMGTKRKFSDEEKEMEHGDFKQYNGYNTNNGRGGSFSSWEEFNRRNGPLTFDEDF